MFQLRPHESGPCQRLTAREGIFSLNSFKTQHFTESGRGENNGRPCQWRPHSKLMGLKEPFGGGGGGVGARWKAWELRPTPTPAASLQRPRAQFEIPGAGSPACRQVGRVLRGLRWDLRRILIDCDKAIRPPTLAPPDQMQGSAMRWVTGDCTPYPALHAAFMPRSPWPRFSACQGTEPSNKFMKSPVICNSCAPSQVRRTW